MPTFLNPINSLIFHLSIILGCTSQFRSVDLPLLSFHRDYVVYFNWRIWRCDSVCYRWWWTKLLSRIWRTTLWSEHCTIMWMRSRAWLFTRPNRSWPPALGITPSNSSIIQSHLQKEPSSMCRYTDKLNQASKSEVFNPAPGDSLSCRV